ncbi:unnamed protein product [Chironomus riparius]|uniref:Carboxylic ester hydrolase n=1 Tax=Chironomus riparius TaxID=315576 RepID=A0A9N9RU38_9DIPT|nr:unnamed protein product [Chironomus riparius]
MTNFEIVQSEFGPIKGFHKQLALNNNCVAFQNVPYMKAPIRNLRFREAQPTEKWQEPLDATSDIIGYCSFNHFKEVEGKEDAGILNIFTKNLKPKKLCPVMVWIHGGGFIIGSSSTDIYGPDYFLQEDIVFVSINYRLGVFGFLSLDDESLNIPGNNGLKDQIFALKWIKKNIANFGGDPNNITIFGESAGGASVHFLCITEQSKGLFQKAIIMSGSALCKTWGLIPQSTSRKHTEILAEKLGFSGNKSDQKSLLQFLEKAPAENIVKATEEILTLEDKYCFAFHSPFVPVIEPYKTKNCFIPKDPLELMKTCWTNKIDILFTGNSIEGIIRKIEPLETGIQIFNKNPSYALPLIELQADPSDQHIQELGLKIKNLYFNGKWDDRESFLRLSSELMFWNPVYRTIQSRIKHAKGKTYLVRFDAEGGRNFLKEFYQSTEYKGASHGDELFYIFENAIFDRLETNSNDFKIMKQYVGILTNFAIKSSPNSEEIEPLKLKELTDPNKIMCLQITEKGTSIVELPESEKLKVWGTLYKDSKVFRSKL